MNSLPIIVVGTPQGFWTQWVRQTLSRLEHAQVHADLFSSEALGTTLEERPEAKALVLVEHPATGLARLLADGSGVDPRAWLDEWLVSGHALLSHAQRHPEDCLMVDADDARCRPEALAVLLQSRWGESFMPPTDIAPACPFDPLASALAWGFVDRSPAVQDVAQELLASCVVLPGDEGRFSALVPRGVADGAAATARLAGLIETERRLERTLREFEREQGVMRETKRLAAEDAEDVGRKLASDRDVLAARVERAEQELADARGRIDATERERASLLTRLDDAASIQAALVKDVLHANGRGDALAQRLDSKQNAFVLVKRELETSQQALEASRAQFAEQMQELHQVQARLDESCSQCRSLEGALSLAGAERAAQCERADDTEQSLEAERRRVTDSEQASRKAMEERDLLQLQLQQAQDELERMFLARRDAEADSAAMRVERETLVQHIEAIERSLQESQANGAAAVRRAEASLTEAAASRKELHAATRTLEASAESLDSTKVSLDTAKKALDEALARQRATQAALSAAHAERDAERKRADDAAQSLAAERRRAANLDRELANERTGGEMLLQQLHQSQEELERIFLAHRDAENALRAATAGPDAKLLDRQLRDTRDECELLTLQMNQVQKELERVHHQKRTLESDARTRIPLLGMCGLSIGEVEVVSERDTLPHREVSFIVRDVRVGARHVAEASVRLVEHWGRPGLVVFAGDGGVPMFASWCESGRENNRPYMLLVHGEEATQRVLDGMGTFDWQLIQALAARLQQALESPDGAVTPTWRSLAPRLLTSLQEQPARLRHEDVRVMPISPESPEEARWGLVLEHASYRGRTWPRLTIRWSSSGPHPSIELVSDLDNGPPLLAWPADEDGAPIRALRLPIGENPHTPEIRTEWDVLVGADKAFVAEVLNLLPILAVHVQASVADAAATAGPAGGLQAAARAAVLCGRAALQPPPAATAHSDTGRHLLQRIVRRLRVVDRPAAPAAVAPDSAR